MQAGDGTRRDVLLEGQHLILDADDLGYSRGVERGIVEAHEGGRARRSLARDPFGGAAIRPARVRRTTR